MLPSSDRYVPVGTSILSISTNFFLTVKCGIDQQSPVGEQRSITRQRRPAIRRRRAFRGSVRRWRRRKQKGRRWSSLLLLLLLLPAGGRQADDEHILCMGLDDLSLSPHPILALKKTTHRNP
ncbi:hypothetical protein BHE74_00001042 [Ensete ventricosum]|nr:hypothetical protein BHE74_00001042 [Ensete ventricosum]